MVCSITHNIFTSIAASKGVLPLRKNEKIGKLILFEKLLFNICCVSMPQRQLTKIWRIFD